MKIKDYYNNAEIINNILNAMRYRCNAFLNVNGKFDYNIHNVVVNESSHILNNMRRFYFNEREYNLYSSVARYDFSKLYKDFNIPPFSYNISKRVIQGEKFNANHKDYILGYDFVYDFDVKESFEKTYDDVKIIKNQLDLYRVPYMLRFSGSGFHIVVPNKYLPERESIVDTVTEFKNLCISTKAIYNIDSLDTGIYDARRVIKTAYSIDMKTGFVCLPLSNTEFDYFTKEFCLPERVIQLPDLFNRNSLLRSGDSNGFEKFIKERLK